MPLLATCATLIGLLASGDTNTYQNILAAFGLFDESRLFLDTHAILSAVECHRAGMDVIRANPCDLLERPHVYGSAWLLLGVFPLDRTWTIPIGACLDLTFLAALCALPQAFRKREAVVLAFAYLSPAVLFALIRANNDILVWLFALASAFLVVRGGMARAMSYAIVCVGALLKFYPLALLVLAARECLARFLTIGVSMGAVLIYLVWNEMRTPLQVFRSAASFTDAFSAWNLPFVLLGAYRGAAWQKPAMWAVIIALMIYVLILAVRMALKFDLLTRVRNLPAFQAMLALAGATMLVACFFVGPSVDYRGIHLLLVMPAILSLWRESKDRHGARLFACIACVIVWCMWNKAAQTHVLQATMVGDVLGTEQVLAIAVVTVLRELAWWWLISVLMALAGCIALTSRAGADFCALLRIKLPG